MRKIRALGVVITLAIALHTVVRGVRISLIAGQIDALKDLMSGQHVMSRLRALDRDVGDVGGLLLVTLLVGGVAWFVWQYRATKNLAYLGIEGREFTPGMAVVWWLIPFASLVKPFQAMRELWAASESPGSWKPPRAPSTMIWWWAGWVSATILWVFASTMMQQAGSPREFMNGAYVAVVADVVAVATGVLAPVVVWGVVARQERAPAAVPAAPPRPDEG